MASVTLSGVRKSFGSTEVVHGVDVGVEDGEFCVLSAPRAAAKSTLLRMIAGLEEISGGRIAIGERVVNGVAPKERDIAMVFQNYALYPHMSVYDNMAFSLKLAGESKEETRVRVEEAALILGSWNTCGAIRASSRAASASACDGTRDREKAGGVPVRRAALQPRRQAARGDAHRDQGAAPAIEDDFGLCHPRQIEAMTLRTRSWS